MPGQPYVGVGIKLCDITVEVQGGSIVMVLGKKLSDQTILVALKSVSSTVAHPMPREMALLSTTAAEKKIVVDLVFGRGSGAIKRGC